MLHMISYWWLFISGLLLFQIFDNNNKEITKEYHANVHQFSVLSGGDSWLSYHKFILLLHLIFSKTHLPLTFYNKKWHNIGRKWSVLKNLFNYLNLTKSKRAIERFLTIQWLQRRSFRTATNWCCVKLAWTRQWMNWTVALQICISYVGLLLTKRSILLYKMMSLPVLWISTIGPKQSHTLIGRYLLL